MAMGRVKYVHARFQSGILILIHHARSPFSEDFCFGGGKEGWGKKMFSVGVRCSLIREMISEIS